jgi:hypothetical protein
MKRLLWITCLVAALTPFSLSANTYTVSNTNDWFFGSLRWAIDDANNHPGFDTIVFNIGSGAKTIKLNSDLPLILDAVMIDGFSQPGWTGRPIIELDGTNVTMGEGLLICAPGVTVRGLVVNRFGRTGIGIGDDFAGHVASGTVIQGCWIGLGLDGTVRPNGRDGIRIFANDCVIGGDGPNQANVISANIDNGIAVGVHPWTGQMASNVGFRTRIQGNIIGLDSAGIQPRGNGKSGITLVSGKDSIIGGDTAAMGNIIAANGFEGVEIIPWDFSNGNTLIMNTVVKNNKIGVTKTGGAIGNGRDGVVAAAPQTTVMLNAIANNGWAGVLVRKGTGSVISNNSISNNGQLGIDLSAAFEIGVSLNDPGDGDTGGNTMINFPVITAAVIESPYTRVTGTYQGAPNGSFTVDVYKNNGCDGSGYGEGEVYAGSAVVNTDGSGNGSFSLSVPWTGVQAWMTATARDAAGNTSEFSRCTQTTYPAPTFTAMSPQGGRVGTTVTITGTNFLILNSVKFWNGFGNTIPAVFTQVDSNTIRAVVPLGAKIGPIVVNTAYGNITTPTFRVTPPTGDFTGDGAPDLLWRNYRTGENLIWTAPDGSSSVAMQPVNDVNWQIQGTGDFNNDGYYDIVWRNYATGETGIWLMNGFQIGGWAGLPTNSDANWHIAAVGDFDRDGDPDLVWRNHATGAGMIWIMNGTTYSGTSVNLPTVPTDYRIEAAGDFNGDGYADLVWRSYVAGDVSIWFMNGTTWQGAGATLPTVGNTNWTIEAAVDWDQDGDLDLVWRNVATGENTVWLLIGPSWNGVSGVNLPTVNDTDMRIEDF